MHILDSCKSLLRGADCRDITGGGGKDPSLTDYAIWKNKLFLRES